MEREELAKLALTDIQEPLTAETVEQALKSPPFIPIPSALNLRDIGLSTPGKIKPNLIFRSGALTSWPGSSKALLATQYHVTTIFDLRHERERQRMPSPVIQGIETVWVPPSATPNPVKLEDYIPNGGTTGFADMYEEVATIYAPAYSGILRHVIEKPKDPFLFHCTAGKDRTGVLAALIESLAGAEKSTIAENYSLTRIGVEPGRELLTSLLQNAFGGVDIRTPGFKELSSNDGAFILAFLDRVEERWSSVEGYCETMLGLSMVEIEKVKANIAA